MKRVFFKTLSVLWDSIYPIGAVGMLAAGILFHEALLIVFGVVLVSPIAFILMIVLADSVDLIGGTLRDLGGRNSY